MKFYFESIKEFVDVKKAYKIPNFTIITGLNGSGKTLLLKQLENTSFPHIDRRLRVKYLTPLNYELKNSGPSNMIKYEHDINVSFADYKKSNSSDLYNSIGKLAKKGSNQLTHDDFKLFFPRKFGRSENIFDQSLSSVYKEYLFKLEENRIRKLRNEGGEKIPYLTQLSFEDCFGEAPWTKFNNLLHELGLKYFTNNPGKEDMLTDFEVELVHNKSNRITKFSELSSGESVLMAFALAIFNSGLDNEMPEVLLLDEPDASLHPSNSKALIETIEDKIVEKLGIKVIMTTHSPSTVALSPEESIFILERNQITGRQTFNKQTKDAAIRTLIRGVNNLSIHHQNRRQVFVESENDVKYYDDFYSTLQDYLMPDVSLSFISSGQVRRNKNGGPQNSCSQVYKVSKLFYRNGNRSIFGIVDWDDKNDEWNNIMVLGLNKRYAIESYILDPLMISALLIRNGIAEDAFLLEKDESFHDFKEFKEEKLQKIVDSFFDLLKTKGINNFEGNKTKYELINGNFIEVPTEYFRIQGHFLENNILLKAFPEFRNHEKHGHLKLKEQVLKFIFKKIYHVFPKDIIELFLSIQRA